MGYKVVCFNCRKSFNRKPDLPQLRKCPECQSLSFKYPHRFRPPKKDNLIAWKVVMFLKRHGFVYDRVYEETTRNESGEITSYSHYVKYPNNMTEAKEFVIKYKDQANKLRIG